MDEDKLFIVCIILVAAIFMGMCVYGIAMEHNRKVMKLNIVEKYITSSPENLSPEKIKILEDLLEEVD